MRILRDTSYLFDFMDRPGMFLGPERRVLAAAAGTNFYVSAVSVREMRLFWFPARTIAPVAGSRIRVSTAFGICMVLLLRMQAWHDAAQMRARAGEINVRRYQPA